MRILFFTPFAERNGAEMMLWYLMKYTDSEQIQCALYCNRLGSLIAELPVSIPYFISPEFISNNRQALPLYKRALSRLKKKFVNNSDKNTYKDYVKGVHEKFGADLWYINTILCPEAVELAIELKIPYVVHFHDLLFLYQHITYKNLESAVNNAKLLVGCSQIVCDKLRVMGGLNIALQYECIDINKIIVDNIKTSEIRKKLNITSSFVWIMSGSVEYRKGTDLIPSIARLLGESVTILWLGPGTSGYSYYIEKEIEFYGLKNVHILGPKSEDYYDYLSVANGLVLTSREDPFPLVMIEAAAIGLPIVAFDSGGVNEFLKEGMGAVVDLANVEQLVQAMQNVANNETGFDRNISIARANEFDAEKQAKLWQNIMLNNKELFSIAQ